MHQKPEATRSDEQRAPAVAAQPADHGDAHSLIWMAVCCAPMVLLLVAIALGWFAIR